LLDVNRIVKGWRWSAWQARERRTWRTRLHARLHVTDTTARVMPAPRGGNDVEQQTEEDRLRL
jgi:hypothetical protein